MEKSTKASLHQTEPGKLEDLFRSWKAPACTNPDAHLYVLYNLDTWDVIYAGYTSREPHQRFQEHANGSHNLHVREAFVRHGGAPMKHCPLTSGRIAMIAWKCVDAESWEREEKKLIAHAAFNGFVANRHRGGGSEYGDGTSHYAFSGYLDEGVHEVELDWVGTSGNGGFYGAIFTHARGTSYLKLEISPKGTPWKSGEEMGRQNMKRIKQLMNAVPGLSRGNLYSHHLNGRRATVEAWLTPHNGKNGTTPNMQYTVTKVHEEGTASIELMTPQLEKQRMREAWGRVKMNNRTEVSYLSNHEATLGMQENLGS